MIETATQAPLPAQGAAPAVLVEGLRKTFRVARHRRGALAAVRNLFDRRVTEVRAVDGVSFRIARGEMVGCLGPNGAGKSTTIKMLTGILHPTAGRVEVLGVSPQRQRKAVARRIGVVFGQRTQLWWDLPLIESLDLLRHIYRVPAARFEAALETFRALLDLDPFLNPPVRQLSLGQRMRGDLAAAMLYEPRILYLDEPTVGLDVVAKERTRQFIERINRETGTTVLLTTHDLADVERLCKRIVFIDAGTVLYDGPVEQLKRRYAPWRMLDVTLAGEERSGEQMTIPGVESVERQDARLLIRFDPDEIAVTDLIAAVVARQPVSDIAIVEPDLESVVREIVEAREVRS